MPPEMSLKLKTITIKQTKLFKIKMKKMVYQQPTTTIVVVEHMQMLASSDPVNAQREGYGKKTGWDTPSGGGVKANGNYVNWDQE